jgi:hypothetical protein
MPSPRLQSYYALGVFCLLLLAASTLCGLRLSRWLAGGHDAAGGPGARFPATPDPAVAETWIRLFDAARSEIWLSAGRIESERALRALDAAERRGARVHLTLSPAQNPSPDAGARAWLRLRTSVRDVSLSRHAFSGAACEVDGAGSVVTAQDILAQPASASDEGIFFYSASRELAEGLRARLVAQHSEGAAEAGNP